MPLFRSNSRGVLCTSSFATAQMLLVQHATDDGREDDGSNGRQPSVEGRGFGEQLEVRQPKEPRGSRFVLVRHRFVLPPRARRRSFELAGTLRYG